MTNLGGNIFLAKYPLVLIDRFFRFYFDLEASAFVVDVFRWDEKTNTITYEVRAGVPQQEGIDQSPNGVVTVAAPDGGFQYKIRSGKKNRSELFGQIPAGEEMSVKITDRAITVWRDKKEIATLQSTVLEGFPVGLRVYPDGTVTIGSVLPDGFTPPSERMYRIARGQGTV